MGLSIFNIFNILIERAKAKASLMIKVRVSARSRSIERLIREALLKIHPLSPEFNWHRT